MNLTLTAEYQPAPAPRPNPSADDIRQIALFWIAGGDTSAQGFATAADPAFYRRCLTGEGLGPLAAFAETGPEAADRAVAETYARATAMAALEAEGWDPPTARAALRAADGNARKVLAAGREGWMGSGYCSGCYENHTSGRHCGCACHTEGKTDTQPVLIPVQSPARPPQRTGTTVAA